MVRKNLWGRDRTRIPKEVFMTLRRGAIEALMLRVLGTGILFLMHFYLARRVGATGYGIISYTISMAAVLAVAVSIGWPTALMRLMAQYTEQKQWSLLRGAVIRSHQVTILVALGVGVGLWMFGVLSDIDKGLATSLRYCGLLLPLVSLAALRRRAFLGLHRVKASAVPDEILFPGLFIVALYVLNVVEAEQALKVQVVGSFIVSVGAYVYFWKMLPSETRSVRAKYKTREWLLISGPMLLAGMSQLILNRTDVLLLGAMTDLREVGLYSAANRVALLITFVMTSVNAIGAPMLTSAFYGERHENFRHILSVSMIWCTVGALPFFAIMFAWPGALLRLFGAEFVEGAILLRILSLGQLVNAMTGLVGTVLTMTGKERTFAWTTGIIALGNAVADLIVIPIWGSVGAAVVTATSVALMNGIMLRIVLKSLKTA
jgi:O-antigen/teichoic acid export membrane protein